MTVGKSVRSLSKDRREVFREEKYEDKTGKKAKSSCLQQPLLSPVEKKVER